MKFNLPGAVWIAIIVGIIPVVQQVITQFYPEAAYPVTAVIVVALGALAKGLQVATTKPPKLIETSVNADGAPLPAAAAAPDSGDYTWDAVPPKRAPGWQRILLG